MIITFYILPQHPTIFLFILLHIASTDLGENKFDKTSLSYFDRELRTQYVLLYT